MAREVFQRTLRKGFVCTFELGQTFLDLGLVVVFYGHIVLHFFIHNIIQQNIYTVQYRELYI